MPALGLIFYLLVNVSYDNSTSSYVTNESLGGMPLVVLKKVFGVRRNANVLPEVDRTDFRLIERVHC